MQALPMLLRKLLVLTVFAATGCAVAPDAVRRMDATRIQEISDYRLCDAAAVNLDLRGQRYPVIDAEIARRGVSCDEHIAAVVSDCSGLQVLNSGMDGTGQGIIFTVRNDNSQAKNFRVRHEERQSRLFTIGPAMTERFGITADPNVARLEEPAETIEGDGGIELLECRSVLASYRFNYRPQAHSTPGAGGADEAAPLTSRAEQGVRTRATRNVTMRAGPGTNHAVVGGLRAGDTVTVLRVTGIWCECMTNGGQRVYVSCSFLSPPPGGWLSLGPANRIPQSQAVLLPLRDGRYVSTNAAAWRGPSCDAAPMADRAVIARGRPIQSPQFGECEYQITSEGRNVYSVRGRCSQDNPPPTRYVIISPTEFSVSTQYGRARYRLCTSL